MRSFITGATGFLGRHLIEHLLAAGDEVTALVRTFDRARALPAAVRTLPGDVLRPAGLRAGMRGAEVVYHLAALRQPGRRVRELGRLDRINVEGTRAVLGLATELGVRRVIYVSDLAVSPSLPVNPHATPYVQSKTRAHHEVRQALQDGLPVTSVSFGPVIGPGDVGWLGGLLGRYALRRLPVMFGGETAYSFVTAQDAVENLRQTALSGAAGEAYTLAGPALTLRELFVQAQRATGLPAPYLWLPAALARLWARALRNVRPDLAESAGWLGGQASTPARRESTHQAARLDEALRASVQWHQEQERQRQEAARLVREQANQPEAPA